jgi:hypothetical protein
VKILVVAKRRCVRSNTPVVGASSELLGQVGGKANARGCGGFSPLGLVDLQGGLDPNKISDLGADFGIIVRSLLELNKSGALKPSLIMS